jgi:glycine/D-amino acid oxidase-like deaminating enzyme
MADADIIVIGSGHNGLVAAAYLAVAGRKVLVLERNEWFGGGVVTRELTRPGLPPRPALDEPHLHPGQSAAAARRARPQAQVRAAVRLSPTCR